MSQAAPNWFQPYFTQQVIHKLQHGGFALRGTTAKETSSNAESCTWRIAARVEATLYQRMSVAKPAGGGRTKVTAAFETWQVYEEVYEDDLAKMTPDEMQVVTKSHAMAIGRSYDNQIYKALNVDTPSAGANLVTDTTNGMTLAAAMLMCSRAQTLSDGQWYGDWYCGLPANLWNQLLAYKQFNSADWIGSADLPFLSKANARDWNGVRWFLMPDSIFPVPGANQVDVFLWMKDCVGYGTNYELKNIIAWEQPKTAWTANMRAAGIAKVLLPEGVVRGRFKSDAAITPN